MLIRKSIFNTSSNLNSPAEQPHAQRRMLLKSMGLMAISQALMIAPQLEANPLMWLFRVLFRGAVRRGAGRAVASRSAGRVLTSRMARGGAYGAGGFSTSRALSYAYDGYSLIDTIRSLSYMRQDVLAVSDEVLAQYQEYDADALWVSGRPNNFSFFYENTTDRLIHRPLIRFEQQNLDTGELFIRKGRIKYLRDWQPFEVGSEGGQVNKTYMTINETGVIEIRPFIPSEPEIIIDSFRVVVASPGAIQWRRS